ncbi:O-antigen ligase family protein [uncultured Nonlabens sp.]|jgi:O-antigen ligase|uniref:O-antigen ligase family protein n=1 Tax=uncultured Nonlabens sp. TaxID=859306 RepID=UPI0030DC5A88
MFLGLLNKVKTSYNNYYENALAILASVMVFRKPGTIVILLFIALNILFYKRLKLDTKKWLPILIIAIPFLLDLFFIWNNTEISDGFKHMEKRLTTFVFPLLIIGQAFTFNLKKVLKIYSICFSTILYILLIRFLIIEPQLVEKYLKGIELWEMGYSFANSTSVHAPALNMHVAFLVVVNTYLFIVHAIHNKWQLVTYRFLLFIASIFMLLIINTRLAIANALLGIFIVLFMELFKKVSRKKLVTITSSIGVLLIVVFFAFAKAFPYIIEKYSSVTFAHMDKVGELDDFENPEGAVFNSFVTRVSIWKTAWERAQDDIIFGVGAADGKDELNQAYIDTNQVFLAKYKFPTHNQYLDFLLKFGILGFIGVLLYIFHILWIGWKWQHSIPIFFFILFFTSNLTDDFLIRYDGITFSALWISIFASIYWNNRLSKDPLEIENS